LDASLLSFLLRQTPKNQIMRFESGAAEVYNFLISFPRTQYASLRIFLPRVQQTLLKGPISGRLREGPRVPEMRKPRKSSSAGPPLTSSRRKRARDAGNTLRFGKFSFGSIRIDGITRDYEVVIDAGEIRKAEEEEEETV
jgi:hypothetical protein